MFKRIFKRRRKPRGPRVIVPQDPAITGSIDSEDRIEEIKLPDGQTIRARKIIEMTDEKIVYLDPENRLATIKLPTAKEDTGKEEQETREKKEAGQEKQEDKQENSEEQEK